MMGTRVAELCDAISTTGLGRDVIRLTRLFGEDARVRHYLLAHSLGAEDPLTEEGLEAKLGDLPMLMFVADNNFKRMRVLGYQRYLIHQAAKLVDAAAARLRCPVWTPQDIAGAITGDTELTEAVLSLADGLGDASHCFNLMFVADQVRDCIERGNHYADAQVSNLIRWEIDSEIVLPLAEECGDCCLAEAIEQYSAFVSDRSGDAYKRAMQYWCGNNRMNLLAMYAREMESDDTLFDPSFPVPDDVPPPPADPHDPQHWTMVGDILVPARA